MIENHLIRLLINVLSLMGILIILLWLYEDYAIDSFRQRMFAIRDGLFDEAREGLIEYDNPAYVLLRGTMNGYIRFGHKLRLLETFILMFILRKKKEDVLSNSYAFDIRWEKAISGLDPAVLEHLKHYRFQMNRIVLKHLILGSPIFLALFGFLCMIVIPIIIKQKIIRFLEDTFKRPLMEIETAALAEGEH